MALNEELSPDLLLLKGRNHSLAGWIMRGDDNVKGGIRLDIQVIGFSVLLCPSPLLLLAGRES